MKSIILLFRHFTEMNIVSPRERKWFWRKNVSYCIEHALGQCCHMLPEFIQKTCPLRARHSYLGSQRDISRWSCEHKWQRSIPQISSQLLSFKNMDRKYSPSREKIYLFRKALENDIDYNQLSIDNFDHLLRIGLFYCWLQDSFETGSLPRESSFFLIFFAEERAPLFLLSLWMCQCGDWKFDWSGYFHSLVRVFGLGGDKIGVCIEQDRWRIDRILTEFLPSLSPLLYPRRWRKLSIISVYACCSHWASARAGIMEGYWVSSRFADVPVSGELIASRCCRMNGKRHGTFSKAKRIKLDPGLQSF